jgi:hypothetical protein
MKKEKCDCLNCREMRANPKPSIPVPLQKLKDSLHRCVCPDCRDTHDSSYVQKNLTHDLDDIKYIDLHHNRDDRLTKITYKVSQPEPELSTVEDPVIGLDNLPDTGFYALRPVDILINKLIAFDNQYPSSLSGFELDWLKVAEFGGKKHKIGSWLDPANKSMTMDSNLGSMARHMGKAYESKDLTFDQESKLAHELHLICRAYYQYIRKQRGIKDND